MGLIYLYIVNGFTCSLTDRERIIAFRCESPSSECGTVLRYVSLPLQLAAKLHAFEVTVLLGLHGPSRNIVTTAN